MSILIILATVLSLQMAQAYATLQVMRRPMTAATLVYATNFENVTKENAYRLNMGIDNWVVFGGDGGASIWMEGLDRNTPGITCHSGNRCVGTELTNITESRRVQFDVYPASLVGSKYFVSVWLYLPQDWGLHAPGIDWNWYEIADPFGNAYGNQYTAIWIEQPDITQPKFNLEVGGRGPSNSNNSLGTQFSLGKVVDFPLPRGRWFNLQYYVFLDPTNGSVEVWLDEKLITNSTGLQIQGGAQWLTCVAKIYYEPTDTTAHQLWVDDLQIYRI